MKLDYRVTYEGFWRRLTAGFVDSMLVFVAVGTIALVALAANGDAPPMFAGIADVVGLWPYAAWLLAAVMLAQIVFWRSFGATPGQLLLGSQVIGARSGRRLTLLASGVRCLGLWLGLACLGIGVLWCIRDARHQGLHDKLARSLVVREDESLLALEELLEGMK